jgi:hypothetical protein
LSKSDAGANEHGGDQEAPRDASAKQAVTEGHAQQRRQEREHRQPPGQLFRQHETPDELARERDCRGDLDRHLLQSPHRA